MRFLNNLGTDLLFALRMSRKSPGFTLVVILSLALGIGASSAIFSLIYAVMFDPYPYRDSDRMLNVGFTGKGDNGGTLQFSLRDFLEVQKNTKTLETVAARDWSVMAVTAGLPDSATCVQFSPNSFEYFGVPAMLGRTFVSSDIPQPAAPPRVAVLSYLFWQRHFNGERDVVGKTLELNHQPYVVLGVVPPRFTWNDADVYLPMAVTPDPRHSVPLMVRVKPGVGLDAVDAELQAMTERFAKRDPDTYPKNGMKIHVQKLNDFLLGRIRGTLLILIAAVGFLLLIACGNVSILLLARGTARQKEIALRLSLGARPARIIQQLLTEAVALAVTGGLLGVLLAYKGVPALVALMPMYSVPHEAAITVNWHVVLFTFSVAVITGILFGLAPALQLAKTSVNQAMQDGGRGSTASGSGGGTRSALIVAEIALTMILLVGAGVAIRGFAQLSQAPLGFRAENVLTFELSVYRGKYDTWEKRKAYFQKVTDQLREIPGVQSASMTESALPPRIGFNTDFEISGRAKAGKQQARIGLVDDEYFTTLGIALLRGRLLTPSDVQRAGQYAVINEEMVHQFWPDGRDPIGAQIQIPGLKINNPDLFSPPKGNQSFEVVGVAATARNRGLREKADPAIYIPNTILLVPGSAFLVRTEGDPLKYVRAVRQKVQAIDGDQPVLQLRTLEQLLASFELAYPRFSTTLFSIFAGVGLLLAATGLYSVVAYTVSHRTHEFGIRMALGAQRWDVLRLVLGATAALVAAGAFAGLLGSLAVSKLIAGYVEGWNPNDPTAYAVVALVLGLVALVACWLPAKRATEIQPMTALRHE